MFAADGAAQGNNRIAHVSADFPDVVEPFKTGVVRDLIALTQAGFDHAVISLNRTSPGLMAMAGRVVRKGRHPDLPIEARPFEFGEAWVYGAPARGVFHGAMMDALGERIAQRFSNERPDLLVGHKLSVEGLAVRRAARMLECPFAISIQGDTDTKILSARPDLRAHFAAAFHEAAVVFPFAPWALEAVEARLGKRRGPVTMLPCPTDLDEPLAPVVGGNGLLSAFHLKNWKRKNLPTMVRALAALGDKAPPLAIAGGGTNAQLATCRKAIGAVKGVTMEGALGRGALRARMNRATAFVMPSRRESFGLVFIEALFAGLPVIYPEGRAISGFFDDAEFAIAVDPGDPGALAAAMTRAVQEEASLKAALAAWQTSEDARRFRRPDIAATFAEGLHAACGDTGKFGREIGA